MTFTRDLLSGLAVLLADVGVGDWNPSGIYSDGQTAITIGGLPASPDMAIALAVYGTGRAGDDLTQSDTNTQIQVRIRGKADPRVVDDLADLVFDALHGLSNHTLDTGVHVLLAQRRIVAPIDRDANGRWGRADSYDLLVDRPSPHRNE
ncbi:minor capsid protein [Nonomuraea sp. NPDC050328]|uniref:minor capsid protein n=1 Tax=Nonomuraea sp. NPDC050328 TaxID=3364361 RepID=UPI0037B2432B